MSEPRPLAGVRVLDLTQFLAGPFATQILGDLGAEVIKLEAPSGDWSRSLPPHFVGPDSAYYLSVNRNKKSVVADMKSADGLALVKRLVCASDIVMENFRPGVLDRLGLVYGELAAENEGLIWCSISGFGQDGPDRDRPAYDMIVQALSGGMSMTGEPGEPAVRAGIPIGDLCAGMYGAIGVLAALEARRRTGKGRLVDVAMLDCQVAMLCYQAAYFLHSGSEPGRQGRGHASIPTYRSFDAGNDTELVITANTERMWRALCGVLQRAELADDPRFATNDDRYANRFELWPLLEAAFREKDADAWVPLLLEAGIPVGRVNTLEAALSNPQIVHRDMVLALTARDGRRVRVAGNPIKFADDEPTPAGFPPLLGENTRDVLADVLGLDEEEIAAALAAGIVGESRPREDRT
ncbi:MAG: CoA transferase [Defluviicoccus sp.]|nr:CoA transferase [Defluviicoccus sp.]MDE0277142.1 CoA transferase [Defluviicoccus sp.]